MSILKMLFGHNSHADKSKEAEIAFESLGDHKIGPKGTCLVCGCSATAIRQNGWGCKSPARSDAPSVAEGKAIQILGDHKIGPNEICITCSCPVTFIHKYGWGCRNSPAQTETFRPTDVFDMDRSLMRGTRRQIQSAIEAVGVDPDLDVKLGFWESPDSGFTYSIYARDCTPLTSEALVWLVWDLVESSRTESKRAPGYYYGIDWYIGLGDGPSVADKERIGLLTFRFNTIGIKEKKKFAASVRLQCGSTRLLKKVQVRAVRISQEDFRAAVSHYSLQEDLSSRPWVKDRGFW